MDLFNPARPPGQPGLMDACGKAHGAGNGQQATGNRQRATGNGQRATGAWQVPDSAMTRPEGDSSSGTQKKLQSHIVAMRNRSRALSVLFACKSGVHSGSPTAQPPHCVAAISLHIVPPGFLIRRLRFSFRSRAVRCGCSRPGRLRQRESRAGQIPFPAAKWFSLFQRLPSSLALALYRS